LTAKSTTSLTRIGVLPTAVSVSEIYSMKTGSVSIAGITSTRRMRETGEKKCVPRKRLPRPSLRAPLRDEMEIEDVFDARPAVGAVIASRR
jgi:hypothetical protein